MTEQELRSNQSRGKSQVGKTIGIKLADIVHPIALQMANENEDNGHHSFSPPDTPTAAARSNDVTAVGIRANNNTTGGLHGELSEFNEDGVLISASAAKMTTVDVDIPIIEDTEEHSQINDPTSHVLSN